MTLERTLTLCALCLGLAIRSSNAQPSASRAQLCLRRDSLVAQIPATSVDDGFEMAARLLPGGFGGLTTTYLFLKEPTLADSMRSVAHSLASCPADNWGRLWQIVQHAEVRQGQYDWSELRRWYDILLKVESAGFYSLDIDEGMNRLSYTFGTSAALEAFRTRAEALGVPSAALILKVETGVRWPDR